MIIVPLFCLWKDLRLLSSNVTQNNLNERGKNFRKWTGWLIGVRGACLFKNISGISLGSNNCSLSYAKNTQKKTALFGSGDISLVNLKLYVVDGSIWAIIWCLSFKSLNSFNLTVLRELYSSWITFHSFHSMEMIAVFVTEMSEMWCYYSSRATRSLTDG